MIEVAAAVIFSGEKVFLASRPDDKPPAGWEFPGGKLEPGENCFDAVRRELKEELDWDIIPEKVIYRLVADKLAISFIYCTAKKDSFPEAKENQQFKWVDLTDGIPDGLLKNDLEFWNFMLQNKINHNLSSL